MILLSILKIAAFYFVIGSASSSTESSTTSVSCSKDSTSDDNIRRIKNSPFVVVGTKEPLGKREYAFACYDNGLYPVIITDKNFYKAMKALKKAKKSRAWVVLGDPASTAFIKNEKGKEFFKKHIKGKLIIPKCASEPFRKYWFRYPTSIAYDKKGSRTERWMDIDGEFVALCAKKSYKECDPDETSTSVSSSSQESDSEKSGYGKRHKSRYGNVERPTFSRHRFRRAVRNHKSHNQKKYGPHRKGNY
jgi:hypothetical protein